MRIKKIESIWQNFPITRIFLVSPAAARSESGVGLISGTRCATLNLGVREILIEEGACFEFSLSLSFWEAF